MSEHTPGPWRVDCGEYSDEYVLRNGLVTHTEAEREANARLIAAAPDLLAAARAVVESTVTRDGMEIAPTRASVEALSAAIAKAEEP